MPQPRQFPLPASLQRRAVVVGGGSFGTAVAVLLARADLRTTLLTRTAEQAERVAEDGQNVAYLAEVELPRELRIGTFALDAERPPLARADYVFLAVPSRGLDEVIAALPAAGLPDRAAVVSLAKGLVPPDGRAPAVLLTEQFGAERVACVGGPAHAREMVAEGAGLVAASASESLAQTLAGVFTRAGVVCEQAADPIGVELAGAAKNAAALAAGATERTGLNAAGAAAGHIFLEVWRFAQAQGARPESMIGLAGTGDLVATALAPESRNRRAGELLSEGVSAHDIPQRVGQAVEALESVPLLAQALQRAGYDAPVTAALGRLIAGELPLDQWVELVRTTIPPPGRWRPSRPRPGFWRRVGARLRLRREPSGARPGS